MFEPRRATLRARLASGPCLGVTWLSLGSAAIVEVAARAAPDAIVIDQQHGLWERRELEAAIGVVPPDIPVLVRVADDQPNTIGIALDAGAEGIIVPLIETAAQARRAVSLAKYPPDGVRSGGGLRPLADFVAYVEGSKQLVTILMIETAKGMTNAREIAATEGVDMIFIGTGDLSLSLGTFPGPSPRFVTACADIRAACDAAGLPCGIFTSNLEAARAGRDEGYRMVVTANDLDLVARGFTQAAAAFGGRV